MKKNLLAMLGIALVVAIGSVAMADKGEGSKHSTEEIMKKVFKGPLLKKVAKGDASEEEQKLFKEMLTSLQKNKPHKGEAESWKKKTTALIEAAKEVAEEKEGGLAKLKKAANCKACHDEHK